MSFISTRGGACVTASQAILRGLAPDGGLYVPAVFPQMTLADIAALTKLDYCARALTILRGYLDDFNAQELADAIASAYEAAKFDDAAIAPRKSSTATPMCWNFSTDRRLRSRTWHCSCCRT